VQPLQSVHFIGLPRANNVVSIIVITAVTNVRPVNMSKEYIILNITKTGRC